MKRIIAAVLIIATMLILFAGCTTNQRVEETPDESMFVIVEGQGIDIYRVVYDKDTKVMYTVSTGGYNGGNFTMLVNADGTPKIYHSSAKDGENETSKDD